MKKKCVVIGILLLVALCVWQSLAALKEANRAAGK